MSQTEKRKNIPFLIVATLVCFIGFTVSAGIYSLCAWVFEIKDTHDTMAVITIGWSMLLVSVIIERIIQCCSN